MPIDDETRSGDQCSREESELSGYVDGLISESIAKRTVSIQTESPAIEPAEADLPPSEGPEVSRPDKRARPQRRQNSSRASMSEDLLEMFRSTQPRGAPLMGARATNRTEPSPYLKQYMQQAERSPELAPSGLMELDEHLGGGFGPGLHIVQGGPGAGKTAFLLSLTLEAVSSGRPVRYYALKEGSLGVWERLVSAFSHILGGPAIPLPALRANTLTPDEFEALAGIDLALKESVLRDLSLIETLPTHPDDSCAFIEDVRSGAEEARKRRGRTPLVIVDDLERLLLLAGTQPFEQLFPHLDDVLRASAVPCLIARAVPDLTGSDAERLCAQTTLTLVLESDTDDGFSQGWLEVEANAATGWSGTLPLLLDRYSGVFA